VRRRARAVRTPRRDAAAGGFTLIEVLVVVVIIAVLTTVAIFSIGVLGVDSGLDAEGDRFDDVVAAALEQAQLEGRDYGVWFGPTGYQVLSFTPALQRWDPIADDRLYEVHPLPAGVTPTLEMEGKTVPIELSKVDAARVPQLLLFASGDASPYRLTLMRDGSDSRWIVEGQADGTLVVTRPGMEP
jgi:general secretion pathway protein H